MTLIVSSLVALLLVIIAALISAGESALGMVSRSDLHEEADESRRPGALREIAKDIDAHITAASFALIAAETIAITLVAVALADMFTHLWPAIVITALVMLFIAFVVIGWIPRSIGRAHPRATIRATDSLLRMTRVTFGPLADLLVAISDAITPGRPVHTGAVTSEEQLLSMVDDAADRDVLDQEDRDLIHSVIDFGDRMVREVMVARTDMTTVDSAITVREALSELVSAGISRAPVIGRDGDDVLGVAYLKDLTRHVRDDDAGSGVLSAARDAEFVPESLSAETLLHRMRRDKIHFAIVVDEYGGVAGLVTLEDLIEELVGEIDDEYDRADVSIEWLDDSTVRVPSRLATSELGELFDLELRVDGVDSVGGLLAQELGAIPDLGDSATFDGLELVADRIGRRRRVTAVVVRDLREPWKDQDEAIPDNLAEVLEGRADGRADGRAPAHHQEVSND